MSKQNDYLKNIEGAERRFFTSEVRMEKRAEGDTKDDIFGYAALFGSRTNIANIWEEEVMPGAFDDVLNDDVRALFNHDPNYILARSVNGKGTLTLSIDAKGLSYAYTTPNRSFALDLQDAIEHGDVTQSSFGFSIAEQKWVEREGLIPLRQIIKVKRLYDVSPVTYPAYNDTEVAKRGYDDFKKELPAPCADDIEVQRSFRERQLIINDFNF